MQSYLHNRVQKRVPLLPPGVDSSAGKLTGEKFHKFVVQKSWERPLPTFPFRFEVGFEFEVAFGPFEWDLDLQVQTNVAGDDDDLTRVRYVCI